MSASLQCFVWRNRFLSLWLGVITIVVLILPGSRAETPPIILEQPVDVTAAYGESVTLRVEAIGPGLTYEWQKLTGKNWLNHKVLGTRETLLLENLAPADAGTYRVVVQSSGFGSVSSREATIAFPAGIGTERIRALGSVGNVRAGRPVGPGVVLNGKFFYPGYEPESGIELWTTDGTPGGTRRVSDIWPGPANGMIPGTGAAPGLAVYNGRAYFVGNNGDQGRALWASDGTAAGTAQIQSEFLFADPLSEVAEQLFANGKKLNSAIDLQISDFVVASGVLWFRVASSGVEQLARTDGTSAGTRSILPDAPTAPSFWGVPLASFTQVRSITPGPNGKVFFVGDSVTDGRELWISDGTDPGTRQVKSIGGGSADGLLAPVLTGNAGKVYFMGRYSGGFGSSGYEPFVSDGTDIGTTLLRDINPEGASSLAFEFTPSGGMVFFSAQSATGMGLWKTDGTIQGTELVREFLGVSRLRAANTLIGVDRLFFMAREADTGFELWVTDGTTAGTSRVRDIAPGTPSSSPLPLGTDGNSLFFMNESPEDQRALWFSNGSEAGTIRLTPETAFLERALLRDGNDTYFAGSKEAGGREILLYKTDGTAANTTLLARVPYAKDTKLQWADLGARKILNTAGSTTSDFRAGDFLVTDGTSIGTGLLSLPVVPGNVGGLTPFKDGLLYITMVDENTAGLYRVDGLTTALLKLFSTDSVAAITAATATRALFLIDSDNQQGNALLTDGTPAGTKILTLRGGYSANQAGIGVLGETFLLALGTSLDPDTRAPLNIELFRIGAAGFPEFVRDLWPGGTTYGPRSSEPGQFVRLGDVLLFFAGPTGALWRTDGTAEGTFEVEALTSVDFQSIDRSKNPKYRPGILGNRIYFAAGFPYEYPPIYNDFSIELWKSGGTPLNTVHLRDINPGRYFSSGSFLPFPVSNSSNPAEFTRVGSMLFFAGTSPLGRELWKTDGTAPGTVQVKDLSTGDEEQISSLDIGGIFGIEPSFHSTAPAINKSNPTNLVVVGDKLFFVARDNEGTKLFRSDGTASGTVAIEPLRNGYGRPRELIACNDRLYFVRGQLGLAAQLWEYDPVLDTQRTITSFSRGVANPAHLSVSDGRLYFIGDEGTGQRLHVYERLPLIKEHPVSQTLLANGSATLSVSPIDNAAGYSWRRGFGFGTPLGNSNSLTVNASNVTAQPYYVRVTKTGVGTQFSHPAHIRVLDPITSKNIEEFPDSWWSKSGDNPAPGNPAIPGTLDLSWGKSNMVNGVIHRIVTLPDGKIIIAGSFSEVLGNTINALARLNHDGTLDASFTPGSGPMGSVTDLAVLPDGKIIIVGNFLTVNGYQREHVARLNEDGTVDLEFKPPISQPGGPQVLCVLPAPDGKVYIGGVFSNWAGHETVSLARLNPDGTVDTTFTASNQPNTGGPFRIAALAFYPDENNPEQILVGGGTYFVEPGNGTTNQRRHIARLNAATGAWDVTFNTAPIPNPPVTLDGSVSKIRPLPDGKILVGGIQGGGHTIFDGMIRLNANGTLDPTFNTGPTASTLGPTIAAAPFGVFELTESSRIVAGGRFSTVQNSPRSNIVQLLPDGMRDPSFVPGEGPNNEVTAIAVQEGGGVLIGGVFNKVNGVERRGLARLHGNPAPPRFILNGAAPQLNLLAADPLNAQLKVNVLGSPPPEITWYFQDSVVGTGPVLTVSKTNAANQGVYYAVIQNEAGAAQTEAVSLTFESGPPVLISQPQNARANMLGTAAFKVEAGGALPLSYQWKLNGQPIPGETQPILRVRPSTYAQLEKSIYTVEVRNHVSAVESFPVSIELSRLATRNTCFYPYSLSAGINDEFRNCTPPTSLDFPSYTSAESATYQAGGFVVVGGGEFTRGGSQWSDSTTPYLMRFTEWGVRAYDGEGRPDGPVRVVASGPDGSVYIAGDFRNILRKDGTSLGPRRWLARYDAQFNFVSSFAPAILPETAQVHGLLVQPDGKLLIAGTFSNVNGVATLGIARLLPNGQSDPEFQNGITFLQYAKPISLALQSNGKILLGGQGSYYGAGAPPGGEYRNQLCRLNPDGSWDASFETAGGAANAGYVENVSKILVQADDRIIITGGIARWGGVPRNGIARLLPDGALDPTFDPKEGPNGSIFSSMLLPSGEVLVTGNFSKFDQHNTSGMARLYSNGSVDEGFYPPLRNGGRYLAPTPDGGAILVGSFIHGPFVPPTGEPSVSTREWVHPQTGSTHTLNSYTFEPQCPGHGSELGPIPTRDNLCGVSFTVLNGVMRLHGTEASPQPPVITLQPSGVQSLTEGGIATLFAAATGEDLLYQWRKDGVVLPNENKPALRLESLSAASSGSYSVLISNALGSVISANAVVKVAPGSNNRGTIKVSPDLRKLEWAFSPAAGRSFTAEDLEKFTLQISEDLKTWITVPGAVILRDGQLVFTDEQIAARQKRFYRLVSGFQPLPASASADPSTQVPLANVPESVRAIALQHIEAFRGDPADRGNEEVNWESVTLAPEARHLFDPAYRSGAEPAYVELRIVGSRTTSLARGYIILSLTEEDFPIVEFGTHGPTKTDQLLRTTESGVAAKFMRFTPGFIVAENASGQLLASLGTTPLRIVGDLPDEGVLRYASFDSVTGTRVTPSRSRANLMPFSSYEELRADFQSNPIRLQMRAQRKIEAGSRWRLLRRETPVLRLVPGGTQDVLANEIFASARVELDEDESSPVAVEVLRNGGLRLAGARDGTVIIRTRTIDGAVAFYTVTVGASGAPLSALGNCGYIETKNWQAGTGWDGDQRQYHQTKRDAWCPSVGCGPTALAMLFGWWDTNGVPSALYRLTQGQGNAWSFRFDFDSLRESDAPKTIADADAQPMRAVYNDLHILCNVMCDPFGSGGGTYPDQLESAFWEYSLRIADVPWPAPMNEFGTGFVWVTSEASWVPPGGMTDWEGGGKLVAQGIKEGRPGIIGIGLNLFDPPHYALAFGYKRITGYVGCSDPEAVETRRFFLVNMGHGSGNPPEWHIAEDVWFGLTAQFWQNNMPTKQNPLGNLPGELLTGLLGTGQKYEVRRPALAVAPSTAQPRKLFLVEGDNHGNTPAPYTRIRSLDGGATFTVPLSGIGGGLFRSGPALVAAADGQRLLAFGLGLDKKLYRATSLDGGQTWADAWTQFSPPRAYESAPAAAASGGATTVHVVSMSADEAYYALVSRNGGITWSSDKYLGGVFKSAPAITASFDGRTAHVFGLGTDKRLWRASTTDAGTNWFGWYPVGEGLFNSAPSAATSLDGKVIHLFARGLDAHYWRYVSLDGGTSWQGAFQVPDGVWTSGPSISLDANGNTLRLVGRGTEPVVPEGNIPNPSEPRIWMGISPDGGNTWPGGFAPILTQSE